jgi:hypothetical protein
VESQSDEKPYRELLRDAIDAAGTSRRKLSYAFAEKTRNQQESEYRSLGKYLDEENPDTPAPERAAILAVLLGEPRLALVARTGRNARLQELAGAVDDLLGTVGDLKAEVQDLKSQVGDLQRQRATGTRASEGR